MKTKLIGLSMVFSLAAIPQGWGQTDELGDVVARDDAVVADSADVAATSLPALPPMERDVLLDLEIPSPTLALDTELPDLPGSREPGMDMLPVQPNLDSNPPGRDDRAVQWLQPVATDRSTGVAGMAVGGLNEALSRGMLEEEGKMNLSAAVVAYQSVVAQFDSGRPAAANAIFRLGECYRKLGRLDEAKIYYGRILREFPDQVDLVKLSQKHLFTGTTQTGNSGLLDAADGGVSSLNGPRVPMPPRSETSAPTYALDESVPPEVWNDIERNVNANGRLRVELDMARQQLAKAEQSWNLTRAAEQAKRAEAQAAKVRAQLREFEAQRALAQQQKTDPFGETPSSGTETTVASQTPFAGTTQARSRSTGSSARPRVSASVSRSTTGANVRGNHQTAAPGFNGCWSSSSLPEHAPEGAVRLVLSITDDGTFAGYFETEDDQPFEVFGGEWEQASEYEIQLHTTKGSGPTHANGRLLSRRELLVTTEEDDLAIKFKRTESSENLDELF